MMVRFIIGLLFALLASLDAVLAAELSPRIEAVKQYLLKDDYPEVFGDKSYRMTVRDIIEADLDDDGEDEVVLHVTPHYLQSPAIIIFKVSKKLKVSRVIEGLAPGPLKLNSLEFMDSHIVGEGIDLTLGEDQGNIAKRKEFVRLTLQEMGAVVEYSNFIHIDSRKGKGVYVDMTGLAKPPTEDDCQSFEFSAPEAIVVQAKNDGSGNYLLAKVGDEIYAYKIHKIRKDGFLEKTVQVLPAK